MVIQIRSLESCSVVFFSLLCLFQSSSSAVTSTRAGNTAQAGAFAPCETVMPTTALTSTAPLASTKALVQDPDLTGTWKLNESESSTPDDGRTDGIRTYIPSPELVLSSDGGEITIVSRTPRSSHRGRGSGELSVSTQILVTDGEPHIRLANGDTVTTRTIWKDGRLVVTSERIIYMGLRKMVFDGTKQYYLGNDGNKLVVEDEIRNPNGMTTRAKVVYDRISRQ